MFITKKRFEKELEKARKEAMDKVFYEQNTERRFAELYSRLDNMMQNIHELERLIHTPICVNVGDHQ